MFPKLARLSLIAAAVLCLIAIPATVSAGGSSKARSVTGCLHKGVEAGGFYILGDDGNMWELSGKVDGKHAGHRVTVTGHVVHKAQVKEAKFDESEKQEAGGKPYADFQVASLKMVSESCK